jgi:hypothetical protein
MTSKKRIRFNEGQWFAVPLKTDGYVIGVIVRGNNKTICLGYFFGPKYETPPGDEATWEKTPENAILITRFGDLGIVNGSWPLIQSTRPFSREEWPIPKFGMEIPFSEGKGYVREYDIDDSGSWILLLESVVEIKEIVGLSKDSFMGGGSVEFRLTQLILDKKVLS